MAKIIGHGQLQHHFWGTYRASIYITFASDALAIGALNHLPGWTQRGNQVGYHGGGTELKSQEDRLVALGANRTKITSIAKSIDYGEPFTIAVPVHVVDTTPQPAQGSLL